MIKISIFFLPLFLFAYAPQDSISLELNSSKFIQIVNNLDSLIQNNQIKNEHIIKANALAIEKINNSEIKLLSGKRLDPDILGGAAFTIGDEQIGPYIEFNDYILEIYSKNPSIVYSILISLYQHIYSFYHNNELYMIAKDNKLEKFFFKMDALYLEAIFIRDYLEINDYNLTKYENYLLSSLNNDGLRSAASFYMKTDLDVAHEMNEICADNLSLDKCLNLYKDIGNRLFDGLILDKTQSRWQQYNSLIPLYTFLQFGEQVLYDIAYQKDDRVNSVKRQLFFSFNDNYISRLLF